MFIGHRPDCDRSLAILESVFGSVRYNRIDVRGTVEIPRKSEIRDLYNVRDREAARGASGNSFDSRAEGLRVPFQGDLNAPVRVMRRKGKKKKKKKRKEKKTLMKTSFRQEPSLPPSRNGSEHRADTNIVQSSSNSLRPVSSRRLRTRNDLRASARCAAYTNGIKMSKKLRTILIVHRENSRSPLRSEVKKRSRKADARVGQRAWVERVTRLTVETGNYMRELSRNCAARCNQQGEK